MEFFQGFKEFAIRGTVVDMGIGLIIGAAFGSIVTSFVSDVLMPPLGLLLGKVDFSNLYINLSGGRYHTLAEAEAAGALTINYGSFIETIIHFVIIAFPTSPQEHFGAPNAHLILKKKRLAVKLKTRSLEFSHQGERRYISNSDDHFIRLLNLCLQPFPIDKSNIKSTI